MLHLKSPLIMISLIVALAILAGCSSPTAGQNPPPAATATTAIVAPTQAPATTAATATSPSTATSAATATTAATATAPATAATTATAPATAPATTAQATAPSAGASTTAEASTTEEEVEAPNCAGSNCDQPGPAITQNLTGNASAGAALFAANCAVCHGQQGKGGVANPGSDDKTVPSLNPVDPGFPKDRQKLALQLDLYIEHGSHTNGPMQMPNWGDAKTLTPQQIADVIAYIMSLNP